MTSSLLRSERERANSYLGSEDLSFGSSSMLLVAANVLAGAVTGDEACREECIPSSEQQRIMVVTSEGPITDHDYVQAAATSSCEPVMPTAYNVVEFKHHFNYAKPDGFSQPSRKAVPLRVRRGQGIYASCPLHRLTSPRWQCTYQRLSPLWPCYYIHVSSSVECHLAMEYLT